MTTVIPQIYSPGFALDGELHQPLACSAVRSQEFDLTVCGVMAPLKQVTFSTRLFPPKSEPLVDLNHCRLEFSPSLSLRHTNTHEQSCVHSYRPEIIQQSHRVFFFMVVMPAACQTVTREPVASE